MFNQVRFESSFRVALASLSLVGSVAVAQEPPVQEKAVTQTADDALFEGSLPGVPTGRMRERYARLLHWIASRSLAKTG